MEWRRVWGMGLLGLTAAVLAGGRRPPGPVAAFRSRAEMAVPAGALPSRRVWIIAASALDRIAGNPAVRQVLDHPSTWVSVPVHGQGLPQGWRVTPFVHFASEAALARAVRTGRLPPGIRGLGYDNERWPLTPAREQRNPARYVARAAALAHRHRWAYLQLGNLPVDGSRVGGARWAQVIDLQVQSAERDPARYAALVRRWTAAARRRNPQVQVVAGLSTNPPPGTPVTLAELEADVRASERVVNGYWLNLPEPGRACPRCGPPDPALAVRLLAWWAAGQPPR
ncbi:MAG: hypothetical protein OWV35_06300 [Firmicutes bacterium]|nr:hypothetical protein [Bacillota bacterium]